jgi:hypothetical protein
MTSQHGASYGAAIPLSTDGAAAEGASIVRERALLSSSSHRSRCMQKTLHPRAASIEKGQSRMAFAACQRASTVVTWRVCNRGEDTVGPTNHTIKLAGPPSAINENPPPLEEFVAVRNLGVNIIAPPMPVLVKADANSKQIAPSQYAERARQAGFDIISWTTERSSRIVEDVLEGGNSFYYQTTLDALTNDGDILRTIDVLAQDVGIIGLFSDWPATTTFYANCLK